MDVACAVAETTTMFAEMSLLNQLEILREFSAQQRIVGEEVGPWTRVRAGDR